MMIAARNAFLMSGAKLPYDAEVEYLESTGTQYVDTGISPDTTTAMTMRGLFPATNTFFRAGCRSVQYTAQFRAASVGGNAIRIDIGTGTGSETNWLAATQAVDEIIMSLITNSASVTVGGVVTTHQFSGNVASVPYAIILFGMQDAGGFALAQSMRLSACVITRGGVIVRDFVPVRVGSGSSAVGYLYDRANPTGGPLGNGLYPNAGTGAFIIGPDK